MRRIVAIVVAACALLVAPVAARGQKPAPTRRSAAAAPAPKPEEIVALFSITTPVERWSLGDAEPVMVPFAGRRLSLAERQVGTSATESGERQLVFPVSWFGAYAPQHPALNYVAVRYRDGRAYQIVAEYLPERFVMPADKFERHPDGRSLYANLEVVRVGAAVFTKQALSRGKVDGHGGVWVDSVILQIVDTASSDSR